MLSARLSAGRLRVELARAQDRLVAVQRTLRLSAQARMEQWASALRIHEERLRAASPQNALKRGFAFVRKKDGTLLRRAQEAPLGTQLNICLSEGELTAEVTNPGA